MPYFLTDSIVLDLRWRFAANFIMKRKAIHVCKPKLILM
jgi:hypothetical protein